MLRTVWAVVPRDVSLSAVNPNLIAAIPVSPASKKLDRGQYEFDGPSHLSACDRLMGLLELFLEQLE
jgi:hypothetical protein